MSRPAVKLVVRGRNACFTRPEMKVERVSYDVITPSAARGILEAIHWKPAIRCVIDRLHVLEPIRFETIRRNEIASKIPASKARRAMQRNAPGDVVRDSGLGALRVLSVDLDGRPQRVHNLEVAGAHTYFAGELEAWGHNARKVPNPNGRRGCKEHQDALMEVVENLETIG